MTSRTMAAMALAGSTLLATALLPGMAADNAPGAADGLKIDTVHSSAIFRVKHMNVSYSWGRFNDISGKVAWKTDAPESSSFDVEIKTDSIDTNNGKRDTHLKGPDFFNTRQFPTMGFKSKSMKKSSDNKFEVTGDFSMHGVIKEITVSMEVVGVNKDARGLAAGFETTFDIKRSDYGLKNMVGPVGDDIRIIVSLEVHG
jgi:polyisoprenoid-binding protein YceI